MYLPVVLHSIGSRNAALRRPRRFQQFHDLSVTAAARVLQRRCTLGIPRLDCGGLMQSKVHCIAEGKKRDAESRQEKQSR